MRKHEIKKIKAYEYKKHIKIIYNVKIIVNNETYTEIKTVHKLNIGWEKCRVFDGTDIIICFKCLGYNHKSSECISEEKCYRCHGNHKEVKLMPLGKNK